MNYLHCITLSCVIFSFTSVISINLLAAYLILYAQFYSKTNSFYMAILYLLAMLPFVMIRVWLFLREIILWRRLYISLSNLAMRSTCIPHWPSFVNSLVINLTYLVYCLLKTKQSLEVMLSEIPYGLVDVIVALQIVWLGLTFKWHETPMTESYRLEESLSFSGGSSMAFGYYYGYLKLILKDLPKKIQDFIDKENIDERKMPVKKLFILIPSSSQVLKDPNQPNIKPIDGNDKLESHKEDRGMVKGRQYKNTMYEIKDKENKNVKYILPVEYASPLKTFYETIDSLNGSKFKEFRREVVASFYYTLENIIQEDKEMRDKVELIYYNDEKAASSDLSTLLKRRIKYLKKLK